SFARGRCPVSVRPGKFWRGGEAFPARADAGGRAIGTGVPRQPTSLLPRTAGGLNGGFSTPWAFETAPRTRTGHRPGPIQERQGRLSSPDLRAFRKGRSFWLRGVFGISQLCCLAFAFRRDLICAHDRQSAST